MILGVSQSPARRLRRSLRRRASVVVALGLVLPLAALAPAVAVQPAWEVQPGPPEALTLVDVAALRTGELWALGNPGPDPLGNPLTPGGVVAHRVDGTWRASHRVPDDVTLAAVAARPGAVWAVGWRTLPDESTEGVILHRGTGGWSSVTVASQGERFGDVAMTGRDQVWISGSTGRDGLLLHFDGRSWQTLHPPLAGTLAVAGPSDVWLANSGQSAHWDGTSWRVEGAPRPGFWEAGGLTGIAVSSDGTQVWAVGFLDEGVACSTDAVLMRHTADGWVPVPQGAGLPHDLIPRDVMVDRTTREVVVVGATVPTGSAPCEGETRPVGGSWLDGVWRPFAIPGTGFVYAVDGDGHGGRYAVGPASGSDVLFLQRS